MTPHLWAQASAGDASIGIRLAGVQDVSTGGVAISVKFAGVRLEDAIQTIARLGGFRTIYDSASIARGSPINYTATNQPAVSVLAAIVRAHGLSLSVTADGQVAIRRVPAMTPTAHVPDSTGTVTGRVSDAQTASPIERVFVRIDDTGRSNLTHADGTYKFSGISDGVHSLTFRRLGYLEKHTAVIVKNGIGVADVALSPSAAMLDEVVTTVTGDRTKAELGNVIATIPADSVAARSAVSDLSDVINGRAAGVQVYNAGGTGTSPDINIRGQNSFTVSTIPLLYIDGVRIENSTTIQPTLGDTRAPDTGRLNDIDPADIESIQIVKGPSAATLYGTDAANGVILITTKHGQLGAPTWTTYGETGVLTVDKSRLPDPYYAWGHTTGAGSSQVECPLLSEASGACVIDSVTHFDPLRDPSLTFIGTGYRNQLGLQATGAVNNTRYFVGGGYEDEVSPLQMDGPDRRILAAENGATGLSAANVRPNGVFRVPLHATLATQPDRNIDLSVSTSVLDENARNSNAFPWISAEEGSGRLDSLGGWNAFWGRPAQLFASRQLESIVHATIGTTANWHPASWFTSHATGGYDFSYDALDELTPANETNTNPTGDRALDKTDVTNLTGDVGATVSAHLLGILMSRSTIGGQYNSRTENDDESAVYNIGTGTTTLSGGTTPPVDVENTIETKTAGAYAQEEVGINDRLFLVGAVRADGAGTFGQDYRAAIYPKASASWLVSDEPFFPKSRILTSMRIRGAFGESGVQPPPTAAYHTVQYQPYYVDGTTQTGAILLSAGNPNLAPERQREYEFGADINVLRDRFHVEATYYHKQSFDALVSLPDEPQLGTYAAFNGGNTEYNIGSVLNWGYELLVGAAVVDSRVFRLDITINGSINHNQLVRLAPGLDSLTYLGLKNGYPLFSTFAQRILSYRADSKGIVESNDVTVGAANTYIGPNFPPSQWSYTATAGFFNRTLAVSALVDTRGGYVEEDPHWLQDLFGVGQAVNDPHASLRGQAAYVAFEQSGTTWGYFDNAAFVRLREVSISYTLPPNLVRRLRGRSATITLAGRNLALWTNFRGLDPELNRGDGGIPANASHTAYDTISGGAPPSQYWIVRLRLGL